MPNLYEPSGKQRISSIDILRGAIMLIMALDHTRDFFHNAGPTSDPTNLATTTPILFFTRWITHFCAPNFVFLSGISAFLAGTRRSKSELRAFLIKRGAWLVFIEVVVMALAFTANPLYNFILLQVLWVIGLSMIILGLLISLPRWAIALIGALILFGHDILDYIAPPAAGTTARVLENLFFTANFSIIPVNKTHFIGDLYALLPWTGVMLLGYSLGPIFAKTFDALKRKKLLLYWGFGALAFFLVFRYFNIYGDPSRWSAQKNGMFTFLSFINVSKYPPSLLYCCLTIGPGLVILALTENIRNNATNVILACGSALLVYAAGHFFIPDPYISILAGAMLGLVLFTGGFKGKLAEIIITYGSVPFLYYVMHFYLLRVITIITFFAQGFKTSQIVTPNNPFLFAPPGHGFNLGGVYLVWLSVIIVLYFPCRWFSKYKKTHNQAWLSYL